MPVYFTKEHEWIRVDGNNATVGISNHAQEQLGDIVFAETPRAGRSLRKDEEAAVVESVKAASDVYSPISGTVIEGNPALADDPAIISGELSTPITSAPRSMILSDKLPSPQPTSRIRSPGLGSSRSRAAPPSSATKAPTRA